MSNFEEEAFARAQQMHRRNSFHNEGNKRPAQQKEERKETEHHTEQNNEQKKCLKNHQ